MLKLVLTLAIAAGGALVFADADAPRDARKELQLMQGQWRERGSLFADTRVLKQYLPDFQEALKSVRIEGNRFQVGVKGQSFVMANDLSMTQLKPPNLDKHQLILFTLDDGRAMLGSYRLEGDGMTMLIPPHACSRTCSTIRLERVKD
ncbi:hypothetical protein AYO44_16005 [Planctomycetaceae bacterium SCGC AG-212-F19]|nr:hypothetical protein AYO44_16005 [Planctomycetaceae bacterium SCGC AG-212-F19]